jgi:uncharacterized protein (DUF3820 family)
MKVSQEPRARQGPPGKVVLRFGKHKGRSLEELPVDYVAALRQFDGLFAESRKQIEDYLRQLVRDPGQAKMPFGAHDGEQLDELESSYLDWLVGEVELGPALGWLVKAELRRREMVVPVYDGSEEVVLDVVRDEDGWGHVLVHTRPKVVGHVHKLEEVEGKEPYDSRGFVPSEGFGGGDRKPSLWSQRRPRAQVAAEDELINQPRWHSGGQRLLWPAGLHLPPVCVLNDRRDRKRTYWSVVGGEPVIKGGDTDVGRLVTWDTVLEAIDQVGGAQDESDLEAAYDLALVLAGRLDQRAAEGLAEMAREAYESRLEVLRRKEVCFTDAEHRVEPAARAKKKYPSGMEAARVHEAVRRMRSCRTLDDLADVGLWVRLHKDEFSAEAVVYLRKWFRQFAREIKEGGGNA